MSNLSQGIYQGVIGYERMKSFIGTFIFAGLAIIGLLCIISAGMNPEKTETTSNPDLKTPSGTASTITTTSGYSPTAWIFFLGCAIICALLSGLSYYMATSKEAEPLLAVNGMLDAANVVGSVLRGRGNANFNLGE